MGWPRVAAGRGVAAGGADGRPRVAAGWVASGVASGVAGGWVAAGPSVGKASARSSCTFWKVHVSFSVSTHSSLITVDDVTSGIIFGPAPAATAAGPASAAAAEWVLLLLSGMGQGAGFVQGDGIHGKPLRKTLRQNIYGSNILILGMFHIDTVPSIRMKYSHGISHYFSLFAHYVALFAHYVALFRSI